MEKYLAAIIFLGVIAVITVFLGLLYLLLKKGCCSCCGGKKEPVDGEEDDDIEAGSENDSDSGMPMYYGSHDNTIDMEANGGINTADPPPVITVSEFKDEPIKKKKNPMKSMLKKMKKPLNKVRFGSVSESEMKPLVQVETAPADNNHLGLQRSDSMESFISTTSGMSTLTENLEEFGEEVSPGRLQLSLEYDARNWTVNVGIKQAECLIHNKNATIYWQVHLTFLPFKKHRFKTKYKASSTPVFNQTFDVDNIPKQALNQISIRLRVYGREGRAGRKKLAGEIEVQLNKLVNAEEKIMEWYVLKRKNLSPKKV